MILDAHGSWKPMPIWVDVENQPGIGFKTISMAQMLLHGDDPRFVHLRAAPDKADFELLIFTDDRLAWVVYDGSAMFPVGKTIPRRSINQLELRSINVTSVAQHGSARQPLTYTVGYPEFSLTLTTDDVLVSERRAEIEAFYSSLVNDWELRRFEHMF